jgi:tetratricopeptide (TPR) repeat protein
VHARVWFAVLLGGAALAAVNFAPRIARWRHARQQTGTAAHPTLVASAAASAPIAPASSAPAAASLIAPPARSATEPAPAATAAAQAKARGAVAPVEGCDTSLIRTAPWRLSPEACARAFEADPTNAPLALAIAHAEHGNGRLAVAAQWANRALALDPNAAEAYVMIGRADAKDGRHDDARAAYRHYLELAPRGWHAAEARAAVRAR